MDGKINGMKTSRVLIGYLGGAFEKIANSWLGERKRGIQI